ncbi:hypothetical protein JYT50_00235 [bacterium AH-315-A23]|nr:hypothetical protein [bacterium AH-315-A23]
MKTQTKITQENLTPKKAHRILVEGNNRFAQNLKAQRNLQDQVFETSKGQFPFAVILSCIDSRVPAELVFDQGIGDIFSTRIAGNIINEDILGSMEYACKVAGSKIVVVMGHTKCGAVTAACQNIELGNITSLLHKIKPAIDIVKVEKGKIGDTENFLTNNSSVLDPTPVSPSTTTVVSGVSSCVQLTNANTPSIASKLNFKFFITVYLLLLLFNYSFLFLKIFNKSKVGNRLII